MDDNTYESPSPRRNMNPVFLPLLLIVLFLAGCATDRENHRHEAEILYRGYTAGALVHVEEWNLDLAEAVLVQKQFVERLKIDSGTIIGYKAALTRKSIQERFGISEPLLGVLTERMIFDSGTTLSPKLGARLMTEGDLVVRVASDEIHQAGTARETLAYLDAVYPFLEIPDLLVDPSTPLSASLIRAYNTGAKAGILGAAIPLENTDAWFRRLGEVQVRVTGTEMGTASTGSSSDLLGHPCNVVLWIKDAVSARGGQLQAGDLLSLGSMTPMQPVIPGSTVRALYSGLDPAGEVSVEASFEKE